MKRLSIIVVLAVSSQVWAGASGITILSQQYRIWGSCENENGRVYYDQSSSSPLSNTLTLFIEGLPTPEAPGGVPTWSHSSASLFHVEAEGCGLGEVFPPIMGKSYFVALAAAEASWTFQPQTTMLEFTVNGGGWYNGPGGFLCALTDITDSKVILQMSDETQWNCDIDLYPYQDPDYLHYWPEGPHFRFNPAHIYRLDLMVDIGGDAFDTDLCVLTASIQQTPAPGAILLGMLGTGLVGWMRRRRAL